MRWNPGESIAALAPVFPPIDSDDRGNPTCLRHRISHYERLAVRAAAAPCSHRSWRGFPLLDLSNRFPCICQARAQALAGCCRVDRHATKRVAEQDDPVGTLAARA